MKWLFEVEIRISICYVLMYTLLDTIENCDMSTVVLSCFVMCVYNTLMTMFLYCFYLSF